MHKKMGSSKPPRISITHQLLIYQLYKQLCIYIYIYIYVSVYEYKSHLIIIILNTYIFLVESRLACFAMFPLVSPHKPFRQVYEQLECREEIVQIVPQIVVSRWGLINGRCRDKGVVSGNIATKYGYSNKVQYKITPFSGPLFFFPLKQSQKWDSIKYKISRCFTWKYVWLWQLFLSNFKA